MSPPKHLWSGDWQRESDAAARERARQQAPVTAPPEEPEPARVPAAPTRAAASPRREAARTRSPSGATPPPARRVPRVHQLADRARAAWTYLRAHLTLDRTQARLAAIVAAVALLVVGGAYGLDALVGGSSSPNHPSVANANAWLGLQMQSLSNGTVVISSVVPGSPAAAAGLRPGDVISEIDRRPVVAPVDVTEAVAALQAGDTIELQLVRGSSTYTTRVKLTARPASFP
jgi:hypothetical protein